MKNSLLFFCLAFSVFNYGQYAKKDIPVTNYLENPVSETNDLFFEKTILYSNFPRGLLNIKNAVLDKVTVYDVVGQLQKTIVILNNNEDHLIDLFQLVRGVYFVVLQKDNKKARLKIVIN